MGKILIIVDREGTGSALPRGLELAGRLGLDAEVCAFVHAQLGQLKLQGAGRSSIKSHLLAKRKEELEAAVDKLRAGKQKVRLRVLWEQDVSHWVCERCADEAFEFVVKTGQRSETLMHTSTDWTLLRECAAPVLIVADNKWRNTAPVLAALDLTATSATKKKLNDAILREAVELAQAMGEKINIIAAVEVPALLKELDLVDPGKYVSDAREAMAGQIATLARRYALSEKLFKVKRGPVEKVIASEAAARRAQIVVMGCVGRKGVRAKLLGNTAEKVLAHLHTDILALKP
ncbi:universal stress protein [Mangrovimicrobium sediminis]|uniref:Universal stress protein n=1 Tax=Mangrovimicrobium sediminis TaxID=2562682 RepID=A0A4Z0M665_9GAMM|nr:universal stress protein [Haliea sp. SAOS-164]TGD75162.1 universal stress protein [Haliea sp. SAOS-164]